MHSKIIISVVFMLFRIGALAEIGLGIMGLLWFADYYFSPKEFGGMAVSVVPLIALLVGVVSPDRLLASSNGFRAALSMMVLGIICVGFLMYGDLTLINGPDYPAFKSRFISMGLILVFVLRTLYCKTQAGTK